MAIILLLAACKKKNSSVNPCQPESFDSYFQTNKAIDATVRANGGTMDPKPYDYQVKTGNNLVFTYTHKFQDCPDMQDDNGSRTVLIEIPATASTFSIVDNEAVGKVLMENKCFCYDGYPHMISRGVVTGKKVSMNIWEVEAKLFSSSDQTTPVYFKRLFTLRN